MLRWPRADDGSHRQFNPHLRCGGKVIPANVRTNCPSGVQRVCQFRHVNVENWSGRIGDLRVSSTCRHAVECAVLSALGAPERGAFPLRAADTLQQIQCLKSARWSKDFAQKDCFTQTKFRSQQGGNVCFEILPFGDPERFRSRVSFHRRFGNRLRFELNRQPCFMNFERRRNGSRHHWPNKFHMSWLLRRRNFSLTDIALRLLFPR
jgi:hypothetical protein